MIFYKKKNKTIRAENRLVLVRDWGLEKKLTTNEQQEGFCGGFCLVFFFFIEGAVLHLNYSDVT